MRLSPQQVHNIQHLVSSQLGADTRLWLFGSRADDGRLGGDVDLLAEPGRPVPLLQTLACRMKLAEALDLKVDLLVRQPGEAEQPIHRIARTTGLPLL
jgi:predicted nucleotidyltransferase